MHTCQQVVAHLKESYVYYVYALFHHRDTPDLGTHVMSRGYSATDRQQVMRTAGVQFVVNPGRYLQRESSEHGRYLSELSAVPARTLDVYASFDRHEDSPRILMLSHGRLTQQPESKERTFFLVHKRAEGSGLGTAAGGVAIP